MPVNLYEPRTMMRAIERMAPVNTFFKTTFFSNVQTFPTKTIEADFVKGNRKLAPFVHPKIGGKTVENAGYVTNIFEPALVAPDTVTSADDLMNRLPGEPLYGGMAPDERAAIKLGQDLAKLDEMITRREEWMCAQALITGKIPVIGEGLNYEIDFQFTNKVTLSGTDLWSDDTSDPIADLEEWYRQVQLKGLVNPDICVMAGDVASRFIQHPKVKGVLDVKNYELAIIAPRQLPNGVTYVGTINKLGLDIYQYNEWYLDDWTDPTNPVTKPLVPDGNVLLLSTRANYTMAYAAITLVNEDGTFYTVEGPRVPDSWIAKKPPRRFVQLNSKPLPIPHEVDSWFVAKVL